MKELVSLALKFENGRLSVLDQTLLPLEEKWLECRSPDDMIGFIQRLQVRGAPLIGVSAVLALAQLAEKGASPGELRAAAQKLREARPTAVNLMNAIDRALANIGRLPEAAAELFEEDVKLCESIAKNGVDRISDGDSVLTHCNTGALATAGIGTALGIISLAHRQGKSIRVFVDETRPLLQGARLTTYELAKAGIPHTLICDNMAAALMAQGKIQSAFVGADRIALNGDFANKIGTYSVAVLCRHHDIPFYAAAPVTTIDRHCRTGKDIPIEKRGAREVTGFEGTQKVQWASASTPAENPAFDVTPRELLTGLVLDTRYIGSDELLAKGV